MEAATILAAASGTRKRVRVSLVFATGEPQQKAVSAQILRALFRAFANEFSVF